LVGWWVGALVCPPAELVGADGVDGPDGLSDGAPGDGVAPPVDAARTNRAEAPRVLDAQPAVASSAPHTVRAINANGPR
jgi:hypothetical protein